MESGNTNRESKVMASGNDEAVLSSPSRHEEAAAAVVAAGGGGEEAASSLPPAPVASHKPYYECVFCKRGFTTAQALGGHMNIHRRDRAKPTRELPAGSSITTVSRNVECYSKFRHLVSYPPALPSSPMPPLGSSSGSSGSLGMYQHHAGTGIAAATADAEQGGVSPSSVSPRELLTLFGAVKREHDLRQGHVSHGDYAGDGTRTPPDQGSEQQAGTEPERELDLELRLGRRPRH